METPFQYPGVNRHLRYVLQDGFPGKHFYRVGSFNGALDAESDLLQMREVAMMILMDRLTDKPNWHDKVFDDTVVAEWRREALTQPEEVLYEEILAGKGKWDYKPLRRILSMPKRTRIVTETAFDSCIAELRCKAAPFKETGLVFTLNAVSDDNYGNYGNKPSYNTIVKADSLVGNELRQGLKATFAKLRAEQGDEPDWRPKSHDLVQDLVHPSMYPFVYGKTKFIQDEVVGVTDAIDKWSSKGEMVPTTEGDQSAPRGQRPSIHGDYINRTYWSRTYQWLPANLAFRDDGTVRFTSYINNLHPKKHPEIYRLVEKLVDTAIPAWERVLSGTSPLDEAGNPQKRFSLPRPLIDEWQEDRHWEKFNAEILTAHEVKEGPIEVHDLEHYLEEGFTFPDSDCEDEDRDEEGPKLAWKMQRLKWREIRDPLLPEPLEFKPLTYPRAGKTLREKFKDTGLQVIVKMVSIELTPEKPVSPAGGWHVEGQMNEHIVATALYYVDSENITPPHQSFRMVTSHFQETLRGQLGQSLFRVYERIYATGLHSVDASTVQTYGNVQTPEGRVLAFPNVFQHAASSFRLQDPTKPGHLRVLTLHLVDPFCRIISTGNVPPQQFDWWAEAVFGSSSSQAAAVAASKGDMPPEVFQLLLERGADRVVQPSEELLQATVSGNRLPTEIMDMVRAEQRDRDGLMTVEEAREHRVTLMEERRVFREKNRMEWTHEYMFSG